MSFELGRTYSGYEFLDVASQTSTTIAYRVRNALANRLELLYVLSQAGEDDPQRRERFLREMRLRARLLHPNIPGFLNATDLDGHLVLMTELAKGRPLAERLKGGPLPWREACGLAEQVLSALDCAHEFGIVHRDVSPESVLVTAEGTVELVNFGMAKGLSSPQLTQAGAIFGNAAYISPEQARGTGELDCRSDIYSVGAVLYHMVCGRPPFVAASEFELMVAHVKETAQAPGKLHAGLPQALDAAIMKALEKDPVRRYANCVEFAEALAAAVGPETSGAEAQGKGSRLPLVYAGGAALAVAVTAVWLLVKH